MKTFLLSIACLLLAIVGQSQDKLFPIRVNHQWGFVDGDGVEVIAPKYTAVGSFGENSYANILLDRSVGLIHKDGRELFIPGVNALHVCNDSTVAVRRDTFWGAYNMDGQELLPIQYAAVSPNTVGHLLVQRGDSLGIKTRKNKYVLSCRFLRIAHVAGQYYKALTADSVRYVSETGELLLQGYLGQYQDQNWPILFDRMSETSGQMLHLPSQRRSPNYQSCRLISGADYYLELPTGENVLYNAINGTLFPVPKGSSVRPYVNGYYKYFKEGKQGVLSAKGTVLIPADFDNISLRNGLFIVYRQRQYGAYQSNGRRVLPLEYDNLYRDPSGLWMLQKNQLLGCAKPNGSLILAPVFRKTQVIDRQLRGDYGDGQIAFVEFDEAWNVSDRFVYKNVKTVFLDFGRVNGPVVPRTSAMDSSIQQNTQNSPPLYWFKSQFNRKWGFRRADSSLRHEAKFDLIRHYSTSGLTETLERIAADASVEVLDGEYYQSKRCGVAFTDNGNYLLTPKYWTVFASELRTEEAEYVKVLRYDGYSQIILRNDGRPVKKLFTFLDSLVEGMARYNVDGNLVVSEDKSYRTNLFTQTEFHRQCNINPVVADRLAQLQMNNAYVRFDYGKWGFLNKEGTNAIDAVYDFVYPFYRGTAIVKYNGLWGVINTQGDFIIKPQYYNIDRVEYEGSMFFHVFKKQARFGLIDTDGNTILYPEFLRAANFKEGMLAIKYKRGWTFMDSTLEVICDAQYEEVQDFSNGRAAVKKNGKWGFINRLGDVVVLPDYTQVKPYANQRTWGYKRGKWYLLDYGGQEVGTSTYKSPYAFSHGVSFVQKEGNNTDYGLLDVNGNFVLKPKFSVVSPFNKHGIAIVQHKNRSALLRADGSFQTDFDFLKIDSFSCGWAVAQTPLGTVLLHHSGRIRPFEKDYQSVEPFINGVARVSFDDLYGYLDTSGQEIVPCELAKARPFSEGKAFIQRKGFGTQCINTRGDVIFSTKGWVQYDYREGKAIVRKEGRSYFLDSVGTVLYGQDFKSARPFSQGVGRVKMEKKWAVINVHGQMLNSPKFVKIKTFSTEATVVKRSGSYGLFSEEGKIVLNVMYDEMQLNDDRYFFLSIQDKVGHYDLEGNWIWEPSR